MNSRIRPGYKQILLLWLLWLLLGCQQTNATPSQSTTTVVGTITKAATSPAIQETRTPTITPVQDIVASSTPTEEALPPTQTPALAPTQPKPSTYQMLPPAQYLVHEATGIVGRFDMTSMDGDFSKALDNGINTSPLPSFSLDGRLMVFVSKENSKLNIYDWKSSTLTEVPVEIECFYPSWSPDKTSLAAACGDHDQLYIIKPLNAVATTLHIWPPSSVESYVRIKRPQWSPDGRWIAFGQGTGEHEILPEDGIFVISTTCLAEPARCPETALGPFFPEITPGGMDFDLAWSPNSRYLAVVHHYPDPEIRVIDIENGAEKILVEPNSLGDIVSIAWSPDGEWIAFTVLSDLGIYKVSPWYAEPSLFIQGGGNVIDWFTVPHPTNPGDKFVITEAGANLNLRASPSLGSASLTKLQPGDLVTVLNGPIEAEGYTWWQLSANEETTGWAVNIPEWYAPME